MCAPSKAFLGPTPQLKAIRNTDVQRFLAKRKVRSTFQESINPINLYECEKVNIHVSKLLTINVESWNFSHSPVVRRSVTLNTVQLNVADSRVASNEIEIFMS